MELSPQECDTLAMWLAEGLHKKQWEIAKEHGVSQPWVSAIVNGHLPKGYNQESRQLALKIFGLVGFEREFIRMVQNGAERAKERREQKRAEKAIQTDVPKEYPLLGAATAERRATVERLPENHPEVQQARKIAQ